MRKTLRKAVALAGLGSVMAVLPARADEETAVALNRLPVALVRAAQQAAPGVRLAKAMKTVEGGRATYDLIGQDPQGREVDVELTPTGEVIGVGIEVPLNKVPRVVLAALKAKGRGITFTDAEAVTRNGRLVAYRFEGETAKGDDAEATVSPDGRSVEIEVDDD